jgi:hypothetical protein
MVSLLGTWILTGMMRAVIVVAAVEPGMDALELRAYEVVGSGFYT